MKQAIELSKNLLIKPFEGCAKVLPNKLVQAYPDPGTGKEPWTIGYGTTGPHVTENTVWTMEQCEAALDEHIVYFLNGLLKLSPSLANENPRRIAAVLSWVYNCGLGNYRISTFKKRIDAKDWSGAQVECRKWNKANGRVLRGLTVRREAEAAMLV